MQRRSFVAGESETQWSRTPPPTHCWQPGFCCEATGTSGKALAAASAKKKLNIGGRGVLENARRRQRKDQAAACLVGLEICLTTLPVAAGSSISAKSACAM